MTVAHPPGGGGGNRGNSGGAPDAPAGTSSGGQQGDPGGGGGGGERTQPQPQPPTPTPGGVARMPSTATTETSSSPSDLSSPTPPTEKTNDDPAASTPPPATAAADGEDAAAPPPPPPSAEELLAAFPVAKLTKLEELISNPRWVIPVLPGAELEVLLETSMALAREGLDVRSDPCQRFYREGLVVSFTKIMTDEAVSSWRLDIHKCILKNCERLVELCVIKLRDDWFPLLDLLGMVLNPGNKFHLYNAPRQSETMQEQQRQQQQQAEQADGGGGEGQKQEEVSSKQVFAQCLDVRQPKGWLVDLLNRFGNLGGFDKLLDLFTKAGGGGGGDKTGGEETELTVPLIHVLVKPFGQCSDLLTQATVVKYLLPIVEIVPRHLESMSEEELKKETKGESKNDAMATIIRSLKSIAGVVPGQEESVRQLEMFRLKMILRQLQVSSFGGKMSALNEVNRVISSVSYYSPQQRSHPSSSNVSASSASGVGGGGGGSGEDEDFLTAERMADWLKENKVLKIVLQDSLHQPQYVEKLEKVIRFLIKEKTLSLEDLDNIWGAQVGQHEAIVKNVHDLLAKLAWDFSPEQLDHLFECFQQSWRTATPKQREKLLELIRRLAEDDKDGVMAEKVLTLFWSLAHNPDTSIELLDQALAAHIKILDYSCTQYRDSQKNRWLERCIEELKDSKWVLPALKQIREICCLYQENPPNATTSHASQRAPAVVYRHEIINKLQTNHALVIVVADNLTNYMDSVRRGQPRKVLEGDPEDFFPDGRYSHIAQVQERLNFLRFLLKDGQLWLCAPQAKQIWTCLAENAVFPQDKEACFKWFSKLMGDEPDLDPEVYRDFLENNILQLDPALMTESGIRCFDRFFKAVNSRENKLVPKRRAFLMDDLELIGMDYIWKLVNSSPEEIASRAIDLLKETYTNLGPRLQPNQVNYSNY